jgi:hypothetical protein
VEVADGAAVPVGRPQEVVAADLERDLARALPGGSGEVEQGADEVAALENLGRPSRRTGRVSRRPRGRRGPSPRSRRRRSRPESGLRPRR